MKKRSLILIVVLIVLLSFNFLNIKPKADSGWDSSYDFGGDGDIDARIHVRMNGKYETGNVK